MTKQTAHNIIRQHQRNESKGNVKYLYILLTIIFLPLLLLGFLKMNSFYTYNYLDFNAPLTWNWHKIVEVKSHQKEAKKVLVAAKKETILKNETANAKIIRLVNEKFGDHAEETLLLLQGESGVVDPQTGEWVYRYWAVNQSSGACGLFQAYPCEKMKCGLGPNDIECQIDWGYEYIKNRYGNSTGAREFWLAQAPHWY